VEEAKAYAGLWSQGKKKKKKKKKVLHYNFESIPIIRTPLHGVRSYIVNEVHWEYLK
jgi:hypothetical protein